jgi:hypothetical protein
MFFSSSFIFIWLLYHFFRMGVKYPNRLQMYPLFLKRQNLAADKPERLPALGAVAAPHRRAVALRSAQASACVAPPHWQERSDTAIRNTVSCRTGAYAYI